MSNKPITFSIVDDDADVRDNIVRFLTMEGELACVGQYGYALDALANLPDAPPSVVLMDIKVKGMDGIECVRCLKQKMPDILVIMLTVFEDDDLIFDALMAGAIGYLLKRQPPEQLLEAINRVLKSSFSSQKSCENPNKIEGQFSRTWLFQHPVKEVLAGGSPMSATIARKVVKLLQRSGDPGKTSGGIQLLFSARQQEILNFLAQGEPYKAIAYKMGLSIHTVRGYIRRIYEKLQVHTRSAAVAKYLQR